MGDTKGLRGFLPLVDDDTYISGNTQMIDSNEHVLKRWPQTKK